MLNLDITANIMVKNEEDKIVRCIESIISFADEIIVVDTGSSDNTVFLVEELIRKYGSKRIVLLFHEWEDDYSIIRNYMVENSKGRFIFQMDADEFLEESLELEAKKYSIIKMLEANDAIILSPTIKNTNGSVYNTIPRIFRNDKQYYFVGNVHEELRSRMHSCLNNIGIDLTIYHDGYEMDTILNKNKIVRNLDLLERIMTKEPDNPRWKYFWIRENYYAGTDREEIVRCAEKFIENVEDRYMLIYIILALCYIEIERYEQTTKIILFLKEHGCVMDACFVELTLCLAIIKRQSLEADKIIAEVCNIKEATSLLNEKGDHVKVQMFKLLFSLERYMEAFCILDEIDLCVKKESITPELIEIKKKIDIELNQ